MTQPAPTCLVCGTELGLPRATCRDCETPYHPGCFEYNGRCATYGCNRMWTRGPGPYPEALPARTMHPTWILNHSSSREVLVYTGSALALLAAPFQIHPHIARLHPQGDAMPLAIVAAVTLAGAWIVFRLLRILIDDHYVIHTRSRSILLHGRFLGMTRVDNIANFADVTHVTLRRILHRSDTCRCDTSSFEINIVAGAQTIDVTGASLFARGQLQPEFPETIAERLALTIGATLHRESIVEPVSHCCRCHH